MQRQAQQQQQMNRPRTRRSFRPMGKRVRAAWLVLLTLAILTATVFLGHYVFLITEISVEGNERFTPQEIITRAGIQVGDSSLRIDEKKAKAAFEEDTYISLTAIRRKGPSHVVLVVAEKKPSAAVTYGGEYILLASDGMVLDSVPGTEGLPICTGLSVSAAIKGNKVQGVEDYAIYAFGLVTDAFAKSLVAGEITGIDMQNPTSINLTTQSGIRIRLGTCEDLALKISHIEQTLPRLIDEGKRWGTLDATGPSGVSYIPE